MESERSETTSRGEGFARLGQVIRMPQFTTVPTDGPTEDERATPDGGPWCPTCRGARWLMPTSFDRRAKTKDLASSALVRCPDCMDTQRTIRLNRLARLAGLSDEQRRRTFDSLNPTRGLEEVRREASAWSARRDGWLLIYGVPGSGKTHLSLAAANAMIAQEREVIWRYTPDVVAEFIQQVANKEPDSMSAVLMGAPVLILDDFAAARYGEFGLAMMERVIERRYRDRLATLFTLIGDTRRLRTPGYDVAADVRSSISESIGRRMQDRDICRVVFNAASQYQAPR